MTTATTRLSTRPSLLRRFLRWLHLRQLRAEVASLQHTVQALETGTAADRLELNRLARMGNKNLILRERYDREMQELHDRRESLERVRQELAQAECSQ